MTIAPPYAPGENIQVKLGRWLRTYVWMAGASLICLGLLWGVMVFAVPHFREVFKDFKINLPALTELILSTSYFLVNDPAGWLVTILLAIFAVGIAPLAPSFAMAWPSEERTRRWIRRAVMGLVILAFLICLIMLAVGLWLPLIKLEQSVSGR